MDKYMSLRGRMLRFSSFAREVKMLSDDSLPQPFRFVNKIVMNKIVGEALETIGKRLNEGNNVGKKFVPTQQGKPIALLTTEQPALDFEEQVSFVRVGYPETLIGCKDGTVASYSTPMRTQLHSTPPIFPGQSNPIVSVDSAPLPQTAAHAQSLYAASNGKEINVFTFTLREGTGTSSRGAGGSVTPETTSLSRRGSSASTEAKEQSAPAASYTSFCSISSDLLKGRQVVDLVLARDASFLAAVLGSGGEVAVFRIPPFKTRQTQPGEASILVDSIKPVQEYITADSPCHAIPVFMMHAQPPSLGYFKENPQAKPLAHTLVIGWTGQNAFTTVALKDYSTGSAKIVEAAKYLRKGSEPVPAATGKEVKDKKEVKGKGGAALVPLEALPCPTPPVDPMHEPVRHRLLPQLLTTVAVNDNCDLVAFGCLDGIVQVWSPSLGMMVHRFSEANYRAYHNSVRLMGVTSLSFVKQNEVNLLVAAISVPLAENHSGVTIYDLGKNQKVSGIPYTSGYCAARVTPQLNTVVFNAVGRWFLSDSQHGDLIAELPHISYPTPEPSNNLSDMLRFARSFARETITFDDSAVFGRHASNSQGSVASAQPISEKPTSSAPTPNPPPAAVVVGTPTPGDQSPTQFEASATLQFVRASDAVFDGYPFLERAFGSCSVDQLAHIMAQLKPRDRNDPDKLKEVTLPGLGTLLGATRMTKQGSFSAGTGVGGRSKTMVSQSGSAAPLAKHKELPKSATPLDAVRYNIDTRDQGRALRSTLFKQHWEMLKQGL